MNSFNASAISGTVYGNGGSSDRPKPGRSSTYTLCRLAKVSRTRQYHHELPP
jgi:hypothetical protein